MQTFCSTWDGISRKLTSFASFSANWPGPDNIALIVPDVNACSRFTKSQNEESENLEQTNIKCVSFQISTKCISLLIKWERNNKLTDEFMSVGWY